jgi:hypothetical protein
MHTHFYPRQVGDPWEDTPIRGRVVPNPIYAPGEFDEFVGRLQKELGEPTRATGTEAAQVRHSC